VRLLVASLACFSLGSYGSRALAHPSTTVGISASALPGYGRVGVAEAPAGAFGLAADVGYANTDDVAAAGASHHRFLGSLSLAATATDWLLVWANLSGYHSRHRDAGQTDTSAVGVPAFGVRAYSGGTFSYGAELELELPGRDAPSVEFRAVTPELRVLGGFDPEGPLVFGAFAGFRLDRSSEAAPDVATLSPADRVALGASEYDALPFGVAIGARFEPVLVFAELSGEPLLGAPLRTSPLRASVGARHALSPSWHGEVLVTAGLSASPVT
jgi:hypothetical protein